MAVMLSCVEHRNSASNKDMHDQEVDHIPKRTYMNKSSFFFLFSFSSSWCTFVIWWDREEYHHFPWENVRKKAQKSKLQITWCVNISVPAKSCTQTNTVIIPIHYFCYCKDIWSPLLVLSTCIDKLRAPGYFLFAALHDYSLALPRFHSFFFFFFFI